MGAGVWGASGIGRRSANTRVGGHSAERYNRFAIILAGLRPGRHGKSLSLTVQRVVALLIAFRIERDVAFGCDNLLSLAGEQEAQELLAQPIADGSAAAPCTMDEPTCSTSIASRYSPPSNTCCLKTWLTPSSGPYRHESPRR